MFKTAQARGFEPELVMFDSWYSGLDNLKLLRQQKWPWLCRLKSNRQVNPDSTANIAISRVDIPDEGRIVHLKGYGLVRVFRTVAPNGDATYWATSQLEMTAEQFEIYAAQAWAIETYHRAIKQCVGIEKAQVRSSRAQRNPILLALRAFIRLELNRLRTGVSWYQAKLDIVRDAIRGYLAKPWYNLEATAQLLEVVGRVAASAAVNAQSARFGHAEGPRILTFALCSDMSRCFFSLRSPFGLRPKGKAFSAGAQPTAARPYPVGPPALAWAHRACADVRRGRRPLAPRRRSAAPNSSPHPG